MNTNSAEGDIQTHLTDRIRQLQGVNHMIAHNLRGAAANIRMLAQVLIDKKIPEVVEDIDEGFTTTEALMYIQRSSDSLLGTLGTLMQVADIELDQTLAKDTCNIFDIVRHVADQLQGLMRQKKAAIVFNLELPYISFPATYMESLLYNLINNAVKYSNPGVSLKIIISSYTKDGRSVLTVKDNGLGIDLKAHGEKIFGLKQVVHSGCESNGIGLYITKTQVESFGGNIRVESTVDEGSEFIVTF